MQRKSYIFSLSKGDVMAKGKDVQKAVKKKPEKSLKEKRNDKKTKKSS